MEYQPAATAHASRMPRRSQKERSRQMRIRIIEAAIEALARDGYAGTSLNTITRTAAVSRGAQGHHFPTKQDLLHAVVKHIGVVIQTELRDALQSARPDADAHGTVSLLWLRLFSRSLFRAYIELLVASQHDESLKAAVRETFLSAQEECGRHYNSELPLVEILLYLSGAGLHAEWLPDSKLVVAGLFPTGIPLARRHQEALLL